MKKAYEVTYKDGNEFKPDVYYNLVDLNKIIFERYHVLNTASAIREVDRWEGCENECAELCRLAGMESEWREAEGDTFEAAKKLNVEI